MTSYQRQFQARIAAIHAAANPRPVPTTSVLAFTLSALNLCTICYPSTCSCCTPLPTNSPRSTQ